jgi:RNA polymerase sigma-70 factor (ECF subfamily)
VSAAADFERRTGPFRGELLAHCYRMLGSPHDAEDLVQETLLRAWRARDSYDEARASWRTWLHRIATNACLTALEHRARRPLPTGLGAPGSPDAPLVADHEVPWLQPIPDARLGPDPAAAGDPASLRLAFVAALQYLPARQRAVLILREVLDFSAAEVAAMLGTTQPAVNSSLQRARGRLGELALSQEGLAEPADPQTRARIERYVEAFERADVTALRRLLTDDVVLEMPPVPLWLQGREPYGRFLERIFAMRGPRWRMVRSAANRQPALAAYVKSENGSFVLHTLQVFTVTGAGISHNVVFQDPAVFAAFDLSPILTIGVDGSLVAPV